jgi:hypothetical protein
MLQNEVYLSAIIIMCIQALGHRICANRFLRVNFTRRFYQSDLYFCLLYFVGHQGCKGFPYIVQRESLAEDFHGQSATGKQLKRCHWVHWILVTMITS